MSILLTVNGPMMLEILLMTKYLYRQDFFLGGKFLGTTGRDKQLSCGERIPPVSYAFCCPVCGDVWARSVCSDPTGETTNFQFVTRGCQKHFKLFEGGSMQAVWDYDYQKALPEAVVQEELLNLIDKMYGKA